MASYRVVDLLRFRGKNLVDLANNARDARQWERAAQLYRKALNRNPLSSSVWVQYGHALKESGELEDPDKLTQAEFAYRRALSLDPGAADTHLQLGHVLKLQGKIEDAQAAYLRAFALDRSMTDSLRELSGLGWSQAQVVELQRILANGSFPENCGQRADQSRSGQFNAVTEAKIRCLKTPSFSDEVALFATHSPHGRLKPHVRHYIESLKRQGISTVLVVNIESPLDATDVNVGVATDGIFIRQNEGFDFAAWAHILRLCPELFDAKILYLLNDSVIGPTNDAAFDDLLTRLRNSRADVIGLTENFDRAWHLQSYFLAVKRRALSSAELRELFDSIVSYRDLDDVISQCELPFASSLKVAGIDCEALFPATDGRDPTVYHWKRLLQSGFPFVKVKTIRGVFAGLDISDWPQLLAAQGYDVSLAERTLAEYAKVDHPVEEPLDPPEYGIKPPPVEPIASGTPGEVAIRSAMLMSKIPWRPRSRPLNAVDMQYLSAKRRVTTGEWLDELHAAAARSLTGSTGELNIDALHRGIGTIPLYEPDRTRVETFPAPILRRYREEQRKIGERFRLEHKRIGTVHDGPKISILMPVYGTPIVYLERAILSVVCQTFVGWELCVVDNGSKSENITAILDYYTAMDQRIRIARIPDNAGISAATNMALELASGSYIGLLDSDDMLTHDALEEVASRLIAEPRIDLVYTDECKIDEHDLVDELMSKPDWSPLLLTSFMYTGHFSVYRTALVQELGGFRSEFDFSQDYDLALRVAECNPVVAHLRQYHYGWRMIAGSAAVGDKPDARQSNIAALQDAMNRRGWGGEAIALPNANRARRTFEKDPPLVSIIVPTDNSDHISQTISSIISSTRYRQYEVVVVTNSALIAERRGANIPGCVRFLDYDKPFNFSDKCNCGAAAADGEYLIFFNDDVRVITPEWIEAILELVTLPGIGIVGPKLLYKDNRIQHAGMVTGTRRLVGTAFHTYPRRSLAHMNLAQSVREVSLISGACLAIEKALFDLVGGFDAVNVPREHSDVDLCLRVRELGYSCIYTPHAELTHIGHASMGPEEAARKVHEQNKHDLFILRRFGTFLADDPYFPEAMWDILYIDSQEEFRLFPRHTRPVVEEPTGRAPAAGHEGLAGQPTAAYWPTPGLDILILSHDLTDSGAPRVVFDIACILRKAGHFVVVVSPSDGPYRERLRNAGVDVIVDELLLTQDHNFFDFARNFDKVICNTIVCWPAVAQLHDVVDVYWYVHENEQVHRLVKQIPELSSVLLGRVTFLIGSPLPANALAVYGLKARFVEYGVDDRTGWRPAHCEKVVIGVFGSYEPRKGQDLAVKGMLSVPQEFRARAELRLFGRTLDVSFRNDIEQIARGDPSIVFFGEMDLDEYLRQMVASDIVLAPARDDPLPFVTLDALSLGKPLLCSRMTGTSAYIQEGRSGLVLNENTPDEIGRALTRLISDRELRAALGKGAREVYEQTFSMRRFAEKLHAALGLEQPAAAAAR
jgi:glycosyltransferase involved in cell wall biosynthesis